MKLNSWRRLSLCAVLCFAWILYPLSAVHAQDETPPPPAPDATEVADPPVESTPDASTVVDTAEPSATSAPDAVIVIVATETATDAALEVETSSTAIPKITEPANSPIESTPDTMIILATEPATQTVSEENIPEAVTGLLVQVDENISQDELLQSLSPYGIVVPSDLSAIHYVLVNVPQSNYESTVSGLNSLPGVLYVEANGELQLEDTIPNDPFFSDQYGLTAIHAPQAWDYTTGSPAVRIAIVDSGVDLTHPDLASRISSGYDFVNNDASPMDDNGHGTHVAGIAAAVTNNSSGVAGVSWSPQIMPVKVLGANGRGSFNNVAQGIIYAADNGAQVINLSLGDTTNSSVLQSAISYAYSHGVVVVAAAGNHPTATDPTSVLYPAAYSQVVAVAASDASNNSAWFSNYGPEVDVTAPGTGIYSTALGGGYGYRSGTSMASAYVTGEVALLLSMDSSLTPDDVVSIIKSTALDIGAPGVDNYTGSGLIQADAAVIMLIPTQDVQTEPMLPTQVAQTEPEPQDKPSRGQEAPLPSPASSGSALPAPTLPVSTPTEPEVSAQSVIQTPAPETIPALETAATGQSPSNSVPAFVIVIIVVIIGAMIFFYLRRNTVNPE